MAYFSNGTEGLLYEERWCASCVHAKLKAETGGCSVWLAHLLRNYDQCNKPDSILHVLIPRSKDGLTNLKCTMHITREEVKRVRREHAQETAELFPNT